MVLGGHLVARHLAARGRCLTRARSAGRMRRSNSGGLEAEIPGGEFRRGGTRATAGPRLGWSGHRGREDE